MLVKVTSGVAEPYSIPQLRRDNPRTGIPSNAHPGLLARFGVFHAEELPAPDYDAFLESIQPVLVDAGDNQWQRAWQVTPISLPLAKQNVLAKIARDRYAQEAGGLTWDDTNTAQVIFLDTSASSQARFAAASAAINAGIRQDGGVWKCAEITGSELNVIFRPTTNAELSVWAALVHDHVQMCFEAEANAAAKVAAAASVDDLRAISFAEEFAAL